MRACVRACKRTYEREGKRREPMLDSHESTLRGRKSRGRSSLLLRLFGKKTSAVVVVVVLSVFTL